MKTIPAALMLSLFTLAVGCSHQVMDSYPRYLSNNRGTLNLPPVADPVTYELTPASENHRRIIRSASAGWANKWILEFGKAMHATMASEDVRMAAPRLARGPNAGAVHLEMNVEEFDFRNHHAYLTLNVRAFKDNALLGQKRYQAEGNSQGGKMFWGGAAAMRNAMQQSSKAAIDQVVMQMFSDLVMALRQSPPPQATATPTATPRS